MIIFIALGMGVFAFGSLALAFALNSNGFYIYEPSKLMAAIEACVAVVFAMLSLAAIVIYMRRISGRLSEKDKAKGYKKLMDVIGDKGGTE